MKKESRISYGIDTTAMFCKDEKGRTLRVGDSIFTRGGATGFKINKIIFSEGKPMLELIRPSYRLASECRLDTGKENS
jgi:hypothetical protein